jgi:hypothetical protein
VNRYSSHFHATLVAIVTACVGLISFFSQVEAQDTTHQVGSTLQPHTPPPAATPVPNPAPTPSEGGAQVGAREVTPSVPDRIVRVGVQSARTGIPRFDPTRIEVTAGQQVEIILRNNEPSTSGITHNWVLIKPGSESAVAALGKQAGVDPDAVTYSPSILAASRTTRPGTESIVDFVAPNAPGTYPFISLVGEQRRSLRGVLIVKPVGQIPG